MTMQMNDFDIINSPISGTLLIEASAGTGKTFTLSFLLLRLIVEKEIPLPQIGAVTFTKAATAELRDRVAEYLRCCFNMVSSKLEGTPPPAIREESRPVIEGLIAKWSGSEISTDTDTIDESERILHIGRLLEQALIDIDNASIFTIHSFCQRVLMEFAFETGADTTDKNNADLVSLGEEIARGFWRSRVLTLSPDDYRDFTDTIKTPHILHGRLAESLNFPDAIIDGIRHGTDPSLPAPLRIVNRLEAEYLVWFHRHLEAIKRKRHLATFDDSISILSKALAPDNPRRNACIQAVQNRYKAILVDEFQDTDSRQFTIFSSLSEGTDRIFFMIGDPKQAIYRFRGGDVYSYLTATKAPRVSRYTLRSNFRTEEKLISLLNTLFTGKLFNAELPEDWHPFKHADIPYHPIIAGRKDLIPIMYKNKEQASLKLVRITEPVTHSPGKSGMISRNTAKAKIRSHLCKEIAELCSSDYMIKERAVTPQDIAILVGTHHEAYEIKESLLKQGIAAVTLKSGSIWNSDEARQLYSILLAVENPADTAILKGVLHTAPFNVSLDNTACIIEDVMVRFLNYRTIWTEQGIMPMLLTLTEQEHLFRNLLSSDNPFEAYRPLTNYRHLFELLHREEESLGRFPLRLIARMHELFGDSEGEEHEQRLESDERAVKIMTIHGSKGLQFPIVFVPYPWSLCYAVMEKTRKKILHPLYHNHKGEILFDISPQELISPEIMNKAETEINEEQLRLFYVALTRAEHRICLYTVEHMKTTKIPETDNPAAHFGLHPSEDTLQSLPEGLEISSVDEYESVSPHPAPESPEQKRLSEYSAEPLPEKIRRGKIIESYSSLAIHTHSTAPNQNEGERDEPESSESGMPAAPDPTPSIFTFPKGAETGNAWHRIFEIIDYTRASTPGYLSGEVQSVLTLHGFSGRVQGPRWIPVVEEMVQSVLAVPYTPLSGSTFTLSRISTKITEMDFFFHLDYMSMEKIRGIIKTHEGLTLNTSDKSFSGFLKGSIDLACEFENTYHIFDWKSNHLGYSPDDYNEQSLFKAMETSGYFLQSIIYSLVMRRYLSLSLGEAFSYESDFGGTCYVFLRGFKNQDTHGFFTFKPKEATLDAIEQEITRRERHDAD